MKNILQKFIDQEIGINLERPLRIDSATLLAVYDDWFSVADNDRGYTHHFPFHSIVQVIEHPKGIDVGGLFEHKKHFNLVIKIAHVPEFAPI